MYVNFVSQYHSYVQNFFPTAQRSCPHLSLPLNPKITWHLISMQSEKSFLTYLWLSQSLISSPHKLHSINLLPNLLSWFSSYLTGRIHAVSKSQQFLVLFHTSQLSGVPQGSILRALLFILSINDITTQHPSFPPTYSSMLMTSSSSTSSTTNKKSSHHGSLTNSSVSTPKNQNISSSHYAPNHTSTHYLPLKFPTQQLTEYSLISTFGFDLNTTYHGPPTL